MAGNKQPLVAKLATQNLAVGVALLAFLCCFSGCALVPDVREKPVTINPFPQLKTIAILPFSNQSEEPTLSGERVAMAYLNEVQAIRGFEVLPLGVVRARMEGYLQAGNTLSSGADFQQFAQQLGVDAVLVGSITDYDSYYPPRMGLKVNWYAANPGLHPVLPGYGLPWGTKEEKKIPRWIQYEAQRALAAKQLETQTPIDPMTEAIMPEDRRLKINSEQPSAPEELPSGSVTTASANETLANIAPGDPMLSDLLSLDPQSSELPANWPDSNGFIPDAPSPVRPDYLPQHEPIISHMRNFNGHDEEFTQQLAEYFYFRDDERFGGWQAYLQRSEDFIRFCCYLHLKETLDLRGGQDKSRLIFRWPIDRYTR